MRQDTHLEADGAELLVQGTLLTEGIRAALAGRREPDYDVLASYRNRACRIQVKMRWATDYDKTFPLGADKGGGCDFVVHVALNRGNRGFHGQPVGADRRAPDYYVLPVEVARAAATAPGRWQAKVRLRRIPDLEDYRNAWHLIRRHLGQPEAQGDATDDIGEAAADLLGGIESQPKR
jgi:hypothetical protein